MNRRYVIATAPEGAAPTPAVPADTGPAVSQAPRSVVHPWANPGLLQPQSQPGFGPLPPYFASTVNAFPVSKPIADSAAVPLALIVHPGQVSGAPLLDYSAAPLTRCERCLSYLSPWSRVLDDQRSWRCPFCNQVNQIHNPSNFAFAQQPEFSSPVYDMVAPPSFTSIESPGAAFLFMIDLSVKAVTSGFTPQCISSIKASVQSLPDTVRVGLLTYADIVTAYSFPRDSVFIVSDLSDPVIPGRSSVSPLGECRASLIRALDGLIERASECVVDGHCYGSALFVAKQALRSTGGIVIACAYGFPRIGPLAIVPGQLGKDGKPDQTANKNYKELGYVLNRSCVSVHLFAMDQSDLLTLSVPSTLTGGRVHWYEALNPGNLHADLFESIAGSYMWDCSVRLRSSAGLKTASVSGSYTPRDQTLFIPILSSRAAIAFEIKIEADIKAPVALFQVAILWTELRPRRLIRVMTFALPTTDNPALVRAGTDEAAFAAFLTKRIGGAGADPQHGTDYARKLLTAISVGGWRYQSLYHLVHGLLASPLLRMPVTFVERRIADLIAARSMCLVDCLLLLYPRMFAVDAGEQPAVLPLVGDSFTCGTVFLVHTLTAIHIWVHAEVSPQVLSAFFGARTVPQDVPQIQTPENQRLNQLINECYALSGKYLPVYLIPAGDPREEVFRDILVDMRTDGGGDLKAFISQMTTFQ